MNLFVGILGGMGTEATTYFYNKLMSYDKANSDQEHLKVMLYNNPGIPDRTEYILKKVNSPLNELIESAKILEKTGVDFIVMPCNTSHYFYSEIIKHVKIPFVNIIKEVALEIKSKNKNYINVGLLATKGTIRGNVYKKIFNQFSLNVIYPNENEQELINNTIYKIKSNNQIDFGNLKSKIRAFCSRENIDIIILGCTELSLIKNYIFDKDVNFIDSNEILAKRTYLYAKRIINISDFYP